MECRRSGVVLPLIGLGLLLGMSCSSGEPKSPASPSAIAPPRAPASVPASQVSSSRGQLPVLSNLLRSGDRAGTMAVTFPPRNEPLDFKQQLEAKYRDQLRRSAGTSFVDIEGDIVWINEYLLYRLNQCGHADSVAKVLRQIDTGVLQALCGNPATGIIPFPPRNEPLDFRNQLEAKYRDGLRRGPSPTYVDLEGDVVWITEYVRYRVNGCGHSEAIQKVFRIIDGGGDQPVCTVVEPVNIVAVITGPSGVVNARTNVTFSGLSSQSNKGDIRSYQWRCSNTQTSDCSASSPTPTFSYLKSGPLGTTVTHTVTLTVTDVQGNTATTTFAVRVSQNY